MKKILSTFVLVSLLGACASKQPAIFESGGKAPENASAPAPAKLSQETSEMIGTAKSSSEVVLSGPCPFTEYRSNFADEMHQWFALTRNSGDRLNYSVLQSRPPGVVIARGDALVVDTNHLDSGPLYLFAIAWTDSRLSTFPVASFDVAGDEKRRGIGVPCLNPPVRG